MYLVQGDDPTFNIMIYGSPGIGKTWLAATAQDHPAMADILVLDVEGGLITVASRGDIMAQKLIAISKFQPIPGQATLPDGYSTLEDEFWKLRNKSPGYENIRTVVIDSGSECQTLNLEIIVANSIRKNRNKHADREQDDIYVEDYGKSTSQLKRLFRYFRDLPINVIITALPKFVYPKTPDGKQKQNASPSAVMPWFTDKLAEAVRGYMDMVWYMFQAEDGKRYLLTHDMGVYKAKTRGIMFSRAIGDRIAVRDAGTDNGEGHTLATLYDLWLETEVSKSQREI